ncbi:hypothetical protein CTI12_AA402230 [Artemisia annua]|uniref:Uncharacterized protein n=1 Tax=Artemisia annua TaxID=35608 RepID=A0A2U1MBI1_ARTAN|nr:hypothetical protein CTI12_AA402230 [Artemisia annua]
MKQHLVSHEVKKMLEYNMSSESPLPDDALNAMVKKMLEYNMSSESPLPDDALNAMVREMLKEIVKRMGVLFQIRFDTVVSKSSSKRTKNQQSCKSYIRGNDFLVDFLNLEDVGSTE